MKIVADAEIAFVDHYFSAYGKLILKPGRSICRNDLMDADILLARSVTPINENLLKGTQVKFVGSTSSGEDHIDSEWLKSAGILLKTASGCNTIAVKEYVLSIIAVLQKKGLLLEKNLKAGVIGVGKIGNEVCKLLKKLGFQIIQCDPFREKQEKNFISTPLNQLENVDFITLHVPLTRDGLYPTFHLIEKTFLQRQKENCILLNTARGGVIHTEDLKRYGQHLLWCLDVWENEPTIDPIVLEKALIATPHIAGHSLHSKYRAIKMIYEAALKYQVLGDKNISPFSYPTKNIDLTNCFDWRDAILKINNPEETSIQLKKNPHSFDPLRKNYIAPYELAYIKWERDINLIANDIVQ